MKRKSSLSILVIGLTVLSFYIQFVRNPHGPAPVTPALTEQAEQHMLYGDKRGGGHLYGTGKPCKSEFPADWNADEIISHVKAVAANDNLDWEEQNNGYYVAEQMADDIKVRVVLNQNRTKIVTAYPTNVKRNDCPQAANDNSHD